MHQVISIDICLESQFLVEPSGGYQEKSLAALSHRMKDSNGQKSVISLLNFIGQ